MLGLGRRSLERDITEVWISRQNGLQVFEVDGSSCEGEGGQGSSGSERWSSGELGGEVWQGLVGCCAGNFRGRGLWVLLGKWVN